MIDFKFFKSNQDSEFDISFGPRIGLTVQSYKIELDHSAAHEYCWWTLRGQNVSIKENDTTFAYPDAVADTAMVLFGLEGAIGTLLNFVLIIALLKNSAIRKEYMTKTIVSILITDFLFSAFWLPIMSLRFANR